MEDSLHGTPAPYARAGFNLDGVSPEVSMCHPGPPSQALSLAASHSLPEPEGSALAPLSSTRAQCWGLSGVHGGVGRYTAVY